MQLLLWLEQVGILAGEQLQHGRAHRIKVGARVGSSHRLLRGTVAQRAHRCLGGSAGRSGQAEVDQFDLAAAPVAQDVGRLDVTVNHRRGMAVQVVEDLQEFQHVRGHLLGVQGTALLHQLVEQTLPAHQVHHQIVLTAQTEKVAHPRDGRMVELRQHLHLLLKAGLEVENVLFVFQDFFDGAGRVGQLGVFGLKDRPHATALDDSHYLIASVK